MCSSLSLCTDRTADNKVAYMYVSCPYRCSFVPCFAVSEKVIRKLDFLRPSPHLFKSGRGDVRNMFRAKLASWYAFVIRHRYRINTTVDGDGQWNMCVIKIYHTSATNIWHCHVVLDCKMFSLQCTSVLVLGLAHALLWNQHFSGAVKWDCIECENKC